MKVEIFIVSYFKDIEWLEYCLKSIKKFATGFSGVTLMVPDSEADDFYPLKSKTGVDFSFRTYDRTPDLQKWHIDHQRIKCFADKACQGADWIFHIDSDCIFREPVDVSHYFRDGRAVLPLQRFDQLPSVPWRACTEEALAMNADYETMRCHGLTYPVGIYSQMRRRIEAVHETTFSEFMLSRKPDYPWGVSEFNLLGTFAFNSPRWFTQFRWLDLGAGEKWDNKIIQYWSHAGIHGEHDLPNGGRGRAIDDFKRLGL
jgi:hypothetical protein